ncbi:hypothetical protein [Streptomyces sp. NPDC096153]|uniref:hypothetical protein n=1 Tax=Streptomyces sp. NPDC096153 TaxID=3155548 RepID=UPI003322F7ED
MASTTPFPMPTELQIQMAALVARQRRQARAERLERKRSEHQRAHLPMDDTDGYRHALDVVDTACALLAPGYPQGR